MKARTRSRCPEARAHPFRFEVRGVRFSSYTVMLYAGLVTALVVGDAVARATGLDAHRVALAMLLVIPAALAGSRALWALLAWPRLRGRWADVARMDRGGAAMYGGLPPALLASLPVLAWLELPFGAFWDLAAVAILAGMIPTRLGCLTNGCCAGRRTDGRLGLLLPDVRGRWERRFPSPLAEVALAAALLALLRAGWGALPFAGAAFLVALGGYAAGRFGLDGLRATRGPVVAGLGACQWISLGFAVACAAGLAVGASVAAGEAALAAAAPAVPADAVSLAGACLALLPVMLLFRFLGCDLIFSLEDPTPRQMLQLAAIVPPTAPADEFTARIRMELEPNGDEIADSPFTLPPKAPLPDGSLVFETLVEIPEGSYVASCTVEHPALITRLGSCSGTLDAPNLAVVFFANQATLPNAIVPVICFEVPPQV